MVTTILSFLTASQLTPPMFLLCSLNTSSLLNWQQFNLQDTNVPGLHLHQTSSSRWASAASRSAASAVSDIPRNLGFRSCQHPPAGTAVSATCHHTVVLNLLTNCSYSDTIIKVTKKFPKRSSPLSQKP